MYVHCCHVHFNLMYISFTDGGKEKNTLQN